MINRGIALSDMTTWVGQVLATNATGDGFEWVELPTP